MIYEHPAANAALTQGDILLECPIVYWQMIDGDDGTRTPASVASSESVIVLTQACDLENTRSTRVQVAVVHNTKTLVSEGVLKAQTIRDQVRRHRVFGWYFLPAGDGVAESIVDLRNIYTVPRELIESQITAGQRVATLATPYREHLAQQFAVTYSRIALPEPFETESEDSA